MTHQLTTLTTLPWWITTVLVFPIGPVWPGLESGLSMNTSVSIPLPNRANSFRLSMPFLRTMRREADQADKWPRHIETAVVVFTYIGPPAKYIRRYSVFVTFVDCVTCWTVDSMVFISDSRPSINRIRKSCDRAKSVAMTLCCVRLPGH